MSSRVAVLVILASTWVAGVSRPLSAGGEPAAALVQSGKPGAPAAANAEALVGAWRLNAGLSDLGPPMPGGADGRGRGRGGPGGVGPGGGGRGGFGGGFGRGGGRGGRGRGEPDEARLRQMEAVRDLLTAPERLTITQSSSMVIITAGDGRTTRLLTDGSEVKDESTRVARRTRWVNGQLVSEISGLIRGKATETYAADREARRLTVTVHVDNLPQPPEAGRRRRPRDPNSPPPPNEPPPDDPAAVPDNDRDAGDGRGNQPGRRDRTFTRVYDFITE